MDIELVSGKYKSIKSLVWNDIPNFVVVTGKNGSGKTQLLELINYELGLNTEQKNALNNNNKSGFEEVKLNIRNFYCSSKDVVFLPANWSIGDLSAINTSNFNDPINSLYQYFSGVRRNEHYTDLAAIVEEKIGKIRNKITIEDIQANLPIDYFDYVNKIQLHEGLSESIFAYHCKYAELKNDGQDDNEIKKEIGEAPWDTINELLENANFPYHIRKPKSYLGNYMVTLVSVEDNEIEIGFSDLSSGEKILISLGIWMFNTKRKKRLPKLLLLDEPDAHLHPSAIKNFIEVVEKTLVKLYGVRVILTTHSPTTVSFSPEYALYEMSNHAPQIKHIESKEYGINLLTEGLVLVKSNSKYVLVEDENDASFYTSLFSILKNKDEIDKNISVVFIPSSNKRNKTSGGSSVVSGWVKKLEDEGVFDIFQGIVDFDDGSPSPLKNIHKIDRHSLENYLLDPLLVFSSIVHDDSSYSIDGIIIKHSNEYELFNQDEKDLQKIANHIFSEIYPMLSVPSDEEKMEEIEFTNGKILMYPKWFLNFRGHDLYAKFRYKYKNAITYEKLVNALIRHEFIPTDLRNIIIKIQNHN